MRCGVTRHQLRGLTAVLGAGEVLRTGGSGNLVEAFADLFGREIAETLVLSERTVINHVSHIFAKTGTYNRAGAAAYALRHGVA